MRSRDPEVLLELLRSTSLDLAQARDTDTVLWTIAETSMEILGYEDCVIYLVDPDRPVLVQRAAFGPKAIGRSEIRNPIEIKIGAGIVGAAAKTGETVRVDDTLDDPRYIIDDEPRRSELAVPIIDDGEVIGVIDSEHSEPCFYTVDDEQALADLAAIATARLRTAVTIEQLERARAALDELAATDPLTGLPNRRAFEEHLRRLSHDARPAIGLIDLDGFGRINDELGHAAGDDLLQQVSTVMRETADHADLGARLDGDEFAVVLDNGDVEKLSSIMGQLIDRIALVGWDWRGGTLHVTASAGVARSNDDTSWADAEEALYLAKIDGKNRIVVHNPEDPRHIARWADRRLARETRDGLAQGRFILYGQPIVQTDDHENRPIIVESLLRYVDDDGSHQTPTPFISAAGQYGLAERVDRWVIEKTVGWLAAHPQAPTMSINVHPNTIVSGDIVRYLGTVLGQRSVEPGRVIVEITENAAMGNEPRFREVVKELRHWGTRVAIDDFGSGWTSLTVARDLEVDFVKIDGAWIRSATVDELSRQVVESVATTASTIGARTVAEWVENDTTRDFLAELGIDYVQGFLIGPPMPIDEVRSQDDETPRQPGRSPGSASHAVDVHPSAVVTTEPAAFGEHA